MKTPTLKQPQINTSPSDEKIYVSRLSEEQDTDEHSVTFKLAASESISESQNNLLPTGKSLVGSTSYIHQQLPNEPFLGATYAAENKLWLLDPAKQIVSDMKIYNKARGKEEDPRIAQFEENVNVLQRKIVECEQKIDDIIQKKSAILSDEIKKMGSLIYEENLNQITYKSLVKIIDRARKGEDIKIAEKSVLSSLMDWPACPQGYDEYESINKVMQTIQDNIESYEQEGQEKYYEELLMGAKSSKENLENLITEYNDLNKGHDIIASYKESYKEKLRHKIETHFMRLEVSNYNNTTFWQKIETAFQNFVTHIKNGIFDKQTRFRKEVASMDKDKTANKAKSTYSKVIADLENEIATTLPSKVGFMLTFDEREKIRNGIKNKENIKSATDEVAKVKDIPITEQKRQEDYSREGYNLSCLRKQLSLALHKRIIEVKDNVGSLRPNDIKKIADLEQAIKDVEYGHFSMNQITDLGMMYITKGLTESSNLESFSNKLMQNIKEFREKQSELDQKGLYLQFLATFAVMNGGLNNDGKMMALYDRYAYEQLGPKIFPDMIKENDECFTKRHYHKEQKKLNALTGVKIDPFPEREFLKDDGIPRGPGLNDISTQSEESQNREKQTYEKNVEVLEKEINKCKETVILMDSYNTETESKAGSMLTPERRKQIEKLIDNNYKSVIETVTAPNIDLKDRHYDFIRAPFPVKAYRQHILLALYTRLYQVQTKIAENTDNIDQTKLEERDELEYSIKALEERYFSMLQSVALGLLYLTKDLNNSCTLKSFTNKLSKNIKTFEANQYELDKKGTQAAALAGKACSNDKIQSLSGPEETRYEWKVIKQYASEVAASKVFPDFIKQNDEYYNENNFPKQQEQLKRLTDSNIISTPKTEYNNRMEPINEDAVEEVGEKNLITLESEINAIKCKIQTIKEQTPQTKKEPVRKQWKFAIGGKNTGQKVR